MKKGDNKDFLLNHEVASGADMFHSEKKLV